MSTRAIFLWKDTCQFLLLVLMISKFSLTIFHWQGFWAWAGNRQLFLDKFWLCLQCLLVSGVLRKFGPSLMPSWEGARLIEKNRTVYKKRWSGRWVRRWGTEKWRQNQGMANNLDSHTVEAFKILNGRKLNILLTFDSVLHCWIKSGSNKLKL